MVKFIELMTSENQAVLQKLACYVHKSFELRNEMLYKRWFYYSLYYNFQIVSSPIL